MQSVRASIVFGCVALWGSVLAQEISPSTENSAANKVLMKQGEFEFKDVTLTLALQQLSADYGVEITTDVDALEDWGISPKETVSLQHPGMTLQSALELLLRQLDLTWVINGEQILITTTDRARDRLETRRYTIGKAPPDDVSRLLMSCTNGLWLDVDGVGGRVATSPGSIEVTQNQRTHREIAKLFGDLARILNPRNAPRPSTVEKSEQALHSLVAKAQFHGGPKSAKRSLEEFVEELSRSQKIPAWLDVLSLEEEGLSAALEFELPGGRTKLTDVLDQISQPHDLTWKIDNETLILTTIYQEAAAADSQIIAYDVSRQVGRGRTPQQLVEALQTESGVEDWVVVDGGGGMAETLANILVVRHTAHAQRKISTWLKTLR